MDWKRLKARLGLEGIDENPVPVLLPDQLRSEVERIRTSNGRVAAVRLVRQRTGLDILSATRAVDALDDPGAGA